jgi:uncharacterized protein YjiS (DUF1127 family)
MQSILHVVALATPARRRRRWRSLLLTLALWHHRHRSRRQLATLDDRELADIGLSRTERWVECDKPFWRA